VYAHYQAAWISDQPEAVAVKEAVRGKAYFGQNCRVKNTDYALSHPGTHVEIGYMRLPGGKIEKHLWAVETTGKIVDLVAPASWSRETLAKCDIENEGGKTDCRWSGETINGKNGGVEQEIADLEWGKRYLKAYFEAKTAI
jgi:hypothetical protein